MLCEQTNKQGLLRAGRTTKQIIEHLAMHLIAGEYDSSRHVLTGLIIKIILHQFLTNTLFIMHTDNFD